MAEVGTLAAVAVGLFPEASAPARFVQMLAEVVPDWRVEPPDADAADLHVAAIAPDGSGRSVAVTADWPSAEGNRDIDEWTVAAHGEHRVSVEMQLCHDAGQAAQAPADLGRAHVPVRW